MSEVVVGGINDYITRSLLRYFRTAVVVGVERPQIDIDQDLDLLRCHWAISKPVQELVAHLREHPHEIQAVLESRVSEDSARVRGRFDARATAIRRLLTGQATVMVSHEPLRTCNSGPNHLLIWVLEHAWRLVLQFGDTLPEGASYLRAIEGCAPGLETIRRFDTIHQSAKELNLTRRPGPQAVKEASRSRHQVYVLACEAYRSLQAIEERDGDEITKLLNDSLLGPLHIWQRFELAVGIGLGLALSVALNRPMSLGFLVGGSDPIARVGDYEVHWQSRTDAWRAPPPEPTEAVISCLFKQYGLPQGFDRPDLVVLDRMADKAVAVSEVKYFSSGTSDGTDALRAAVNQVVRYARGYCEFAELDELLDHSVVALACMDNGWNPEPKPLGLPLVVDFMGIIQGQLNGWAQSLVKARTPAIGFQMGA